MRIGELAERAGTTTRALRYYEARGLLHAERTANGHRIYSEADLRLLQQIQMLQRFGFELEETRPFVECLRAGHPAGDACPAALQVYRHKLAELDACITQLQDVREQVGSQLGRAEQALSALANASAQPGGPHPRCELSRPDS
ncbi:MerR family transcriptional regulator [Streptomyces sp. CB02923]|uniref:MerR family transcriptional regulator n=1 Tax=Streptomyces sp. CB02923 TaxID=1718985 RepID=UPI00093A6136|nr:MerR family transcriptional regulator [Streptomyces sp. CB02923]OKH99905.1 MerR family transcriptional regulator [Streptomyces sp. CB02923]